MPGYINLLQGKIVRFEEGKTSEDFQGFFTDGVTSCCIIIFSGKNEGKRRLSAIHSDGNLLFFHEERILEEMSWVGQLEKCCIYRVKFYDQKNDEYTHPHDIPRPIIRFLLNHLQKLNIPLNQAFFKEEDYGEMSFTFDEREPYGYKAFCTTFSNFPLDIISHPDTLNIYSYYKFNSLLQEQHSNMLLKQDSSRRHQWNTGNLSSLDKERGAIHPDSSLTHNPMIFDGERFIAPLMHDLTLTKFAIDFLGAVDDILRSSSQLRAIQLEYQDINKPITLEQCAVVEHLLNIQDFDGGLGERARTLNNIYNECTMISDLYAFIKSNFSIDSLAVCQDEALTFILSRYSRSIMMERTAPMPQMVTSTSLAQAHDICFWVRHTNSLHVFDNMKKEPKSITTFPTRVTCFSSKEEAIKYIEKTEKNGYKKVFIFTMKGNVDRLINQKQFTSEDFISYEDRTPAPKIEKTGTPSQQCS